MNFHKQPVEGVWLVEADVIADNRGAFRRHFCQNEFKEAGLEIDIVQTNISENSKKHTLRGFHYQRSPHEEAKVLTCIKGASYNAIVDLRPDSESYLKWMPVKLRAGDNFSVYVPSGCANAFLTLEDSTTILYYMSEFYSPGTYTGFRYNDPLFSVNWPAEPKVISEKDENFENFNPNSIEFH
jgi:dTDP-4-dehydrorhamnose 3,5-epimerase